MNCLRWKWKAVVSVLCLLVLLMQPMQSVFAVTVYESDGAVYEEGYIFVGESHVDYMAQAIGGLADDEGCVYGLSGIRFYYREDGSLSAFEDGAPNTMFMKGNLFFAYEGRMIESEGAVQTDKEYIYSDGHGNHGRGVERVHEIMETNPDIAHWNIICYQGAVSVSRNGPSVGAYYVSSYRNWIEYEFPDADIYFLSQSTMTKVYRSQKARDAINNALAAAFPDQYLDYMDFFYERYPQGMKDPKERSDTLHWSSQTYIELVTDVIREIQHRRGIDHTVTDIDTVLYTNDGTVIYSIPDWDGKVLFSELGAGLPIHVTGVTDNGFFRIDLGEMTAYVYGTGLSEAGE